MIEASNSNTVMSHDLAVTVAPYYIRVKAKSQNNTEWLAWLLANYHENAFPLPLVMQHYTKSSSL